MYRINDKRSTYQYRVTFGFVTSAIMLRWCFQGWESCLIGLCQSDAGASREFDGAVMHGKIHGESTEWCRSRDVTR